MFVVFCLYQVGMRGVCAITLSACSSTAAAVQLQEPCLRPFPFVPLATLYVGVWLVRSRRSSHDNHCSLSLAVKALFSFCIYVFIHLFFFPVGLSLGVDPMFLYVFFYFRLSSFFSFVLYKRGTGS